MRRRLPWIVFSAWIACLGPQALGGDCAPVRLDGPGQPFENIPTYNQEGIGICFAYAASQLIDARKGVGAPASVPAIGKNGLPKKKKKVLRHQNTNPGVLALDYLLETGGHNFAGAGGMVCTAIEIARKKGVCRSGDLREFESPTKVAELQYRLIEEQKKELVRSGCLKSTSVSDANLEVISRFALEQAGQIATRSCQRVKADLPPCKNFSDESASSSRFQSMIDASLSESPAQPVEVGISNFLFSYDNFYKKKFRIERRVHPEGEFFRYNPHSVVIIGRKPDGAGGCKYLVKNTNTFCPADAKERGWECENGNRVWVGERELMDSVFQVSGFSESIGK